MNHKMKNKFLSRFALTCIITLASLFACAKDTPVPKVALPVLYKGINLSGAEFGTALPGVKGTDYTWPTKTEVDYFASKGMNTIRLQFQWERLQPTAKSVFTTAYATDLDNIVVYATSKGMNVLLNPQNFARYYGKIVGSADVPNDVFADLWTRLALKYANNPKVMFGLVNEPHDMATEQWLAAANAATAAIRAAGAKNVVTVPGNAWTGAAHWTSNWYGTPNSTVLLNYVDSGNNSIFEVHNYLDSDAGGGGSECVNGTIGSERMKGVVAWARTNNKKIMLAEFGAPNTATCKTAITDLLTYVQNNSDVVVGWQWWAAGPDWGNYALSIEPNNGVDRPQMSWILPFLQNTPPPPVDAGVDSGPVDAGSNDSGTKPSAPISFNKNTVFPLVVNNVTSWAYVPTAYDNTHNTPNSLFVWLHGCGGQGQYDIETVSPGGTQTWVSLAVGGREGSCWSNVSTDGPKILAAIADIKTHFNIDPRRVFLGGYSSGGDIGYPLIFQNAKLFAGALFENTGPSAAALTASQTAAWKLNIAHLAHTSDDTYPIAGIRSSMNTLKNNGFPVILIEKPGTHWDNDNGTTGTDYDLRTFLLPYLKAGWMAPGDVVSPPVDAGVDAGPPVPPPCQYAYSPWNPCNANGTQTRTVTSSSPNPCTPSSQLLTQACVYVDTGDTDLDTIPNSLDKCPNVAGISTSDSTTNGCAPLQVTAVKTYDWGTGYCKQFSFKNVNPMAMKWKSMTIYLKDGKLRGTTSVWGANFTNPTATGTIIVTPVSWTSPIAGNTKIQTVGFCADKGTSGYIATNGGLKY